MSAEIVVQNPEYTHIKGQSNLNFIQIDVDIRKVMKTSLSRGAITRSDTQNLYFQKDGVRVGVATKIRMSNLYRLYFFIEIEAVIRTDGRTHGLSQIESTSDQ